MYANTSFAHNIDTRYGPKNETAAALNQSGSTGWFNPATAIQVKSRKPTRFIFLIIDIEITRLVFSAVHIEPKTHNKMVQIRLRYTRLFGTQLQCHLRVYKKDLNPRICFRAKKADELAGKLWLELHKKPLVWLYWLCIALLFWSDLWYISDLCLSNSVRFQAWVYQLKQFDCTSYPGRSDLPKLTFLVSLLKQDTPRKGRIYKSYKYKIQKRYNWH